MNLNFKEAMSKRTDNELIEIVTTERLKYKKEAVIEALNEIKTRGLQIDLNLDIEIEENEINSTEENEINKTTRMTNYMIDTAIIYAVFFILHLYFMSQENTSPSSDFYRDSRIFLFFISFFSYYLIMESFFSKTIGKYITATKVITIKGGKPNFETILGRTLSRLIPFDNFSFLIFPNGIHDELSGTKLVKVK